MSGALNSVFGGNGGLLGAVGGLIGEAIGGPIGEVIGQAVGNLLQQAIGDALKGAMTELQQEHGMPGFLADMVKNKADDVISGLHHHVPADVQQAAHDTYGGAIQDFKQEFQRNLVKSVLQEMGGEDGKVAGKGAKGHVGGGWLQAIAKAMGNTLGDKAAEMVQLSNKMSELNKAHASIDKKDTQANEANAREFNQTMTQFQATSQEYSMLNNVFSTAIKALGESLSSMARKQ